MSTKTFKTFALLLLVAGSFSCEEPEQSKSSEKKILSIEAEGLVEIDYKDREPYPVGYRENVIWMTFDRESDLSSIVPVITLSSGATISPASDVPQDFLWSMDDPDGDIAVIYTVTAKDGTSVTYRLIAVWEAAPEEVAALNPDVAEKENLVMTRAATSTVNIGANKGGTTNPSGVIPYDTLLPLFCKAIPDPLYRFDYWLVNNDPKGTNPQFNAKVPADAVVTALFLFNANLTVTVQSENNNQGTVSGGGTVYVGSSISISATPAAGYAFEGWYKNGVNIGLGANANYTPTENCTLSARFEVVVPPIYGPEILCVGSSGTYTINMPPYTPFRWETSPNLSLSGSGNSVTVTATGGGTGWVRVKIYGVVRESYNVWIGGISNLRVTGPMSGGRAGGQLAFSAISTSPLTSVSWSISPNTGVSFFSPSGNFCSIAFTSAAAYTSYTVTATASNGCGQSTATYSFTMGGYSGDYAP